VIVFLVLLLAYAVVAVCLWCSDADLEDDLSSDEELQVQAKLAAPPVPQRRQRVRVTQSRRRPPLAPARAADNTAGKQQKGTTGSAPVKRSFLTLAVSTGGCTSSTVGGICEDIIASIAALSLLFVLLLQ
jgi:hypothetical protein